MKKPVLLQGGPASGKTYMFNTIMRLIQDLGFSYEHTYARRNENETSHGVPIQMFKDNDAIIVMGVTTEKQLIELYHLRYKYDCWLFMEMQNDLKEFSSSILSEFNVIQFGYDERRNSYRIYEPSKIPA